MINKKEFYDFIGAVNKIKRENKELSDNSLLEEGVKLKTILWLRNNHYIGNNTSKGIFINWNKNQYYPGKTIVSLKQTSFKDVSLEDLMKQWADMTNIIKEDLRIKGSSLTQEQLNDFAEIMNNMIEQLKAITTNDSNDSNDLTR